MNELKVIQPRQDDIATFKLVHNKKNFASVEDLMALHMQIQHSAYDSQDGKAAVLIEQLIATLDPVIKEKYFDKDECIWIVALGESNKCALMLVIYPNDFELLTTRNLWNSVVLLK